LQLNGKDCWGPHTVIETACYSISRKLESTKQCISLADAIIQSNDTNLLQLRDLRVREVTHVGSNMDTDLTYVRFALPALEVRMFEEQFGGHLLLDFVGPFVIFLLAHKHAVTLHIPWQL
jgi:hypothetical protein